MRLCSSSEIFSVQLSIWRLKAFSFLTKTPNSLPRSNSNIPLLNQCQTHPNTFIAPGFPICGTHFHLSTLIYSSPASIWSTHIRFVWSHYDLQFDPTKHCANHYQCMPMLKRHHHSVLPISIVKQRFSPFILWFSTVLAITPTMLYTPLLHHHHFSLLTIWINWSLNPLHCEISNQFTKLSCCFWSITKALQTTRM